MAYFVLRCLKRTKVFDSNTTCFHIHCMCIYIYIYPCCKTLLLKRTQQTRINFAVILSPCRVALLQGPNGEYIYVELTSRNSFTLTSRMLCRRLFLGQVRISFLKESLHLLHWLTFELRKSYCDLLSGLNRPAFLVY